jgi:hypothetical protein
MFSTGRVQMAKPKEAVSTEQKKLQIQIAELQAQVASLSQIIGANSTTQPRYPMWSLVRDYLRSVGGSASPRSIADGLLKAGHKLGKYPLRNVKITVTSPMMHGIFKVTRDATNEETVMLMNRLVPYTPKKWVDNGPARRAKR